MNKTFSFPHLVKEEEKYFYLLEVNYDQSLYPTLVKSSYCSIQISEILQKAWEDVLASIKNSYKL